MIATPIVNQATIQAIAATGLNLSADQFGAIALILLILILVEQLLAQAYGGGRSEEWNRAFQIGLIPLLAAFTFNVALAFARFLDLI